MSGSSSNDIYSFFKQTPCTFFHPCFSPLSHFPFTTTSLKITTSLPHPSLPSMEASSSSPPQQPLESGAVDSIPNSTAQDPSPPLSTGSNDDDDLKPMNVEKKDNKKRKKMKKKRVFKYGSNLLPPSSSSCGSLSSSSSTLPATRVVLRRRNPRALLVTARRSEGSLDAIGLPLGMSVAAVVALVRKLCFFVYLFGFVLGLLMPLCVISFEFGKFLVLFGGFWKFFDFDVGFVGNSCSCLPVKLIQLEFSNSELG